VYWHDEISVKRRMDAMELERLNENVGTEVVVWHGTWVTLAVADTSDFILEQMLMLRLSGKSSTRLNFIARGPSM
jgi:hypothetical protein